MTLYSEEQLKQAAENLFERGIFPASADVILENYKGTSEQVKSIMHLQCELDLSKQRMNDFKERFEFLNDPQIERLNIEKNPVTGNVDTDLVMRHPLIGIMVQSFGDVLADVGAPNFFTMEMFHPIAGKLELTIQRVQGVSMAEGFAELRGRCLAAERQLLEGLDSYDEHEFEPQQSEECE